MKNQVDKHDVMKRRKKSREVPNLVEAASDDPSPVDGTVLDPSSARLRPDEIIYCLLLSQQHKKTETSVNHIPEGFVFREFGDPSGEAAGEPEALHWLTGGV